MASSGVLVDVNVDETGLTSKLDEVTEGWEGHREAVLIAQAESLVGSLKREVNTSSGRLSDTIRALETSGNSVPVVAGGQQGVDYTLANLHGSDPHAPGSPDPAQNRTLSRWASREGYPGGFEGIYWHIYHYGTEEHDWLTPALDDYRSDSAQVAETVLRNRGVLE